MTKKSKRVEELKHKISNIKTIQKERKTKDILFAIASLVGVVITALISWWLWIIFMIFCAPLSFKSVRETKKIMNEYKELDLELFNIEQGKYVEEDTIIV